MTNKELLDLYSDYLIATFGYATGTGMSTLLNGQVSHDRIQRLLAKNEFKASDLWQLVKPQVRRAQREDGVLIVDDTIAEKPYTDENDIICWHWDHSQERMVKGINFLTVMYHAGEVSLPISFEVVAKTEHYVDKKDSKQKRRSPKSKNEIYRELLQVAVKTETPFQYVLNDAWYASAENMEFVKLTLKKEFVMPLKSNRKVALSAADKQAGQYQRVDQLTLEEHTVREVYLEGGAFPLVLTKQVFTNEDRSTGVLYLVSSELTLTALQLTTLYRQRWHVEPYHKSLKQNVALEKSPTQTEQGQRNHLLAALWGYCKLEALKGQTRLTHFALKSRLYMRALQAAFSALRELQAVPLAACVR
jgi:hypothetical protein